jgi:hypothetical protein
LSFFTGKFSVVSGLMKIEELHILPKDGSPEVMLNPKGFIRIDGRGIIGHNYETSELVLNWIHEYLKNPAELTTVIVALEYINSLSTVILVSILKEISQVVQFNKQYFVHWCYEEEDEDILERGEYISTTLNIPIDFIRTKDVKHCCKSIC